MGADQDETTTLLLHAGAKGDIEALRSLAARGVDLNQAIDANGNTAAEQAARGKHWDFVIEVGALGGDDLVMGYVGQNLAVITHACVGSKSEIDFRFASSNPRAQSPTSRHARAVGSRCASNPPTNTSAPSMFTNPR